MGDINPRPSDDSRADKSDPANDPDRWLDPSNVPRAAQRIAEAIYRTPLVRCDRLSKRLGMEVRLKAENLQVTGSFKDRGANNAVLSLGDTAACTGVVTHSSGNHAVALARAATRRGIPAHIVMPENSLPNKLRGVRDYGIEPILSPPDTPSRLATAQRVQAETGAEMVSPFNDTRIIDGQGTVAMEIFEDWPDVEVIVVPIGGGGLVSGALSFKRLQPHLRIIGVEPELADDTYRSLSSGQIEMPTRYDTMADGLRSALGSITFPTIQRYLDDLWLVGEARIAEAMRTLVTEARLVAEPSGAVSLAGLERHAETLQGRNVAIVISGGNLNMDRCGLGRDQHN